MSDAVDDEGDYFIPLTDQRVFGAGIKRKGIAFIPAASNDDSVSAPLPTTSTSAGDRYLSIVLGKKGGTTISESSTQQSLAGSRSGGDVEGKDNTVICPVCRQRVTEGEGKAVAEIHESSIAHQVCMQHSHPPSHLDRDRVGLRYLSGYGWDPDARQGLGARAEGIRIPIKAKEKRDTSGLGAMASHDDDPDQVKSKPTVKKEGKVIKLNLKEVRKLEQEKQKRAERLRQAFYGEDLSHYLGPGG